MRNLQSNDVAGLFRIFLLTEGRTCYHKVWWWTLTFSADLQIDWFCRLVILWVQSTSESLLLHTCARIINKKLPLTFAKIFRIPLMLHTCSIIRNISPKRPCTFSLILEQFKLMFPMYNENCWPGHLVTFNDLCKHDQQSYHDLVIHYDDSRKVPPCRLEHL